MLPICLPAVERPPPAGGRAAGAAGDARQARARLPRPVPHTLPYLTIRKLCAECLFLATQWNMDMVLPWGDGVAW